ncbi:MAG: hypothetical protein L0I48_03840 [Lactococcus plantarum]|nr:hypothetical protein [Lactococcus plantarum]MDN6085251.1 hypothetical protein [Lactococcus plantarum]
MKQKLVVHFATFSMATFVMMFVNMLSGVVYNNAAILSLMVVCAACTLFCNMFLYYVPTDFGNILTVFGVLGIVYIGSKLFGWELSILDLVMSGVLTLGLIFANYELNSQTARKMNQQLEILKEAAKDAEKSDDLK